MSSSNSTGGETSIPSAAPPTSKPAPVARRGGTPWAWALIACALLGAAGAVRATQDRRHQSEKAYKATCPIDLAKIPESFGDEWRIIKGTDSKLDPLTMRITGGTDHLIRTYANNLTGVFVTVLVLFGPAEPVLPHTPQVCYPSSGFTEGDAPTLRPIRYPIGNDSEGRPIEGHADFLMASYAKPNGRQMFRQAVYHSFRLDGEWSPFLGQGRRFPRRNPGIFKVQIHRMAGDHENLNVGDPIEQFLQKFLPALESEIKDAAAKDAAREVKAAAK